MRLQIIPMYMILVTLSLFGPSLERTARDSTVYSLGYLDSIHHNRPAVDIAPAQTARLEVSDALAVYCGGRSYESGGKCQKPKDKLVRSRLADNLRAKLAVLDKALSALDGTK